MENIKSIICNDTNTILSSINVEEGIIIGVKEADYGLNKNGYYFDSKLLNDLMEQGNAGQGIKSGFGHPNEYTESLGTYIGRKKNYRIVENALYCDFYLDDISKDTLVNGTSTWNYILKMAANNPDMMGNSVVFTASLETQEIEGVEQLVPTLIKFSASDLVDEPAATNHLFNSETKENMSNKIKNILEDVKLAFNAALDGLKATPEELANEAVETLDTGVQIIIDTDDTDVPKVGDSVTLEDGTPAPDAAHVTESGLTVTTEGGVITEIVEAEPEVAEEIPAETMEAQFKELQKDFLQFQEDTNEFMTFSANSFKDALATIKESTTSQELAFSEMKAQAEASEAKYITLASSIQSPAANTVIKEVLPAKSKSDGVSEYLNKRNDK